MKNAPFLTHSVLAAWAATSVVSCSGTPAETIATEARLFMNAYGDDLRTGNREAISARYHPDGVFFLGNGSKSFESFSEVRQYYLTKWRAPSAFEWCDLSIEPISKNAVVVAARFLWRTSVGARYLSYSALLVRQEGLSAYALRTSQLRSTIALSHPAQGNSVHVGPPNPSLQRTRFARR